MRSLTWNKISKLREMQNIVIDLGLSNDARVSPELAVALIDKVEALRDGLATAVGMLDSPEGMPNVMAAEIEELTNLLDLDGDGCPIPKSRAMEELRNVVEACDPLVRDVFHGGAKDPHQLNEAASALRRAIVFLEGSNGS